MERDDHRERAMVAGRVVGPGRGAWFRVAPEPAGETLLVHGVCPGERVLVAPRPADPGFADPVRVLERSPARREPPCRHAARCGGCHWLHLDDRAQRALRRDRVDGALAAAGLDPAAIPRRTAIGAGADLGYRWRARFQTDTAARPPRIGFHRPGSWRVLDIDDCPLLAAPLARVYGELRRALSGEPIDGLTGFELTSLPGAPGALCFLNPRDRAPDGWPACGERLLARLGDVLAGVAVRPTRGIARDLLGEPAIFGRLGSGSPVAAAARGFVQAHLAAADHLADAVATRAVAGHVRPRVLELFAGTGLLGWRIAAAGADVLAIERDALSVAAGRRLPAPPRGRLAWAEPADALARVPHGAEAPFDVLVADPPRSGLGPLAGRLARSGPPRIVLVSCSAEAFARDATRLVRGGYVLRELLTCELFPQTRHVELVGVFERQL